MTEGPANHSAARDRLIVALDYPDAPAALHLVDMLGESIRWYKVGLELYLATGASVVERLVARGKSVFLDLKLHDIPNTVAGAVRSAAASGASLLTAHASGGPAMIEAAVNAAASLANPPKVLAVTVLTSMDESQLRATGVERTTPEQVELLAKMAMSAGADGLVCSPLESQHLRRLHGQRPLLVTPGIRPDQDSSLRKAAIDDQRRIASPRAALWSGASYLVVGRPITQATDPKAAAFAILDDMKAALDSPQGSQ